MNTITKLKLLKMEKPNKITPPGDYYYEYDPGFLEKKCLEKLNSVVAGYQATMDSDAELRELKEQIETLNKKYNGDEYDAC
jgi:hypothetical protein